MIYWTCKTCVAASDPGYERGVYSISLASAFIHTCVRCGVKLTEETGVPLCSCPVCHAVDGCEHDPPVDVRKVMATVLSKQTIPFPKKLAETLRQREAAGESVSGQFLDFNTKEHKQ